MTLIPWPTTFPAKWQRRCNWKVGGNSIHYRSSLEFDHRLRFSRALIMSPTMVDTRSPNLLDWSCQNWISSWPVLEKMWSSSATYSESEVSGRYPMVDRTAFLGTSLDAYTWSDWYVSTVVDSVVPSSKLPLWPSWFRWSGNKCLQKGGCSY